MGSKNVYQVNYYEKATMATAAPVAGDTATRLPVVGMPRFKPKQERSGVQVANILGASVDEPNKAQPVQSFPFSVPLFTGATDFGAGLATTYYLSSLWESYWGGVGVDGGGGTTVGSAPGPGFTTSLVVASTTGILAGHAIMVNGEVAFVTNVPDATHLKLDHDLTAANSTTGAAPANGDVVYVAMNFKATLGQRTKVNYINVEQDGYQDLIGHGQVTSMKIPLSSGGEVLVEMEFQGDAYAAGFTPSSSPANAYTGTAIQAKSGLVVIANTAICISDGSMEPNLKKQWRPCASGAQGRDGVETVAQDNPMFTFSEFYNSTRKTRYSDAANFNAMMAWKTGSTAAGMAAGAVAMWLPSAQVVGFDPKDIQDQDGQGIQIVGRHPAGSSNAVVAAAAATAKNGAGLHPVHFAIFGGNT